MAEYIELPLNTDITTLQDIGIEYLEAQVEGWEANPGNLETWVIEAVARIAAETALVATQVPPEIFRFFGDDIAGIAPIAGATASVGTTWTANDTLGHTIQEDTYIDIEGMGFVVDHDVEIPVGSSSTAAGEVLVYAVEIGEQYNGLNDPIESVEALDWLNTITAVGFTSGGTEEETVDDYLDRLRTELALQSPRPILPNDFAVLANRIPGVERATAIDGYDSSGGTYNNERMIAIAAVDAAGEQVSPTIKTQIQNYLDSLREINFVVNVIDPTYKTVTVSFTAKVNPGFDANSTRVEAEQAVIDYLSPANWGKPAFDSPMEWVNMTTVRYLEIAQVINTVAGIDYISALTVDGGTVNVNLTGAAPLTRAGVVAGTVS